eukprot:1157617-Pelagomonas_calceolata.AAC.2
MAVLGASLAPEAGIMNWKCDLELWLRPSSSAETTGSPEAHHSGHNKPGIMSHARLNHWNHRQL